METGPNREKDEKTLLGAIDDVIREFDSLTSADIQLKDVFKPKRLKKGQTHYVSRQLGGVGLMNTSTLDAAPILYSDVYNYSPVTQHVMTWTMDIPFTELQFRGLDYLEEGVALAQALKNSYINTLNGHLAAIIEGRDTFFDGTNSLNSSAHTLGALYSSSHTVEKQVVFDYGTTWSDYLAGYAFSTSGGLGLDDMWVLAQNTLDSRGNLLPQRPDTLIIPKNLAHSAYSLLHAQEYTAGMGSTSAKPAAMNPINNNGGVRNAKFGNYIPVNVSHLTDTAAYYLYDSNAELYVRIIETPFQWKWTHDAVKRMYYLQGYAVEGFGRVGKRGIIKCKGAA
jgi:hypothetical protein